MQAAARPGRASRLQVQAAIRVRPYTVRKGDTLSTIAKKRGTPAPACLVGCRRGQSGLPGCQASTSCCMDKLEAARLRCLSQQTAQR